MSDLSAYLMNPPLNIIDAGLVFISINLHLGTHQKIKSVSAPICLYSKRPQVPKTYGVTLF
jgi:hypothetical protein